MGCATSRPGKTPAPPKSPNPPPLMGSPFDGPSDGTRNKNSRMAKLRIKTSRDGFAPVPLKPIALREDIFTGDNLADGHRGSSPAKENCRAGQRYYRHLGNRNPGVEPKSLLGESK
ncbi:hypothetical protein LTR12_003001 [Friedmanniomyces endolithicus]|nr:hypothetical protein LTR12_003001 [Friedmanniomyces endolithicus]